MARVFIGVGSNEGDRLENISTAAQRLGAAPGVRVIQMAAIRETAAVGGPAQGPYLNTVVELDTSRAPRELLNVLQGIEQSLGRAPSQERWGPRPIDLDLLLYDDRVMQEPDLAVPHPRMHERWFVLEPLAQLAPDLVHPVLRRPISSLLERVLSPQPASP